ncbi:MAG: acyltransferase [Phycisphaerae bacterium]|nr:acyltransferase [Phycisphaerae bacterium]
MTESAGQRFRTRFARITSSGRFIPEIDGLRFLAISWVVLFHVWGSVPGRQQTDACSALGAAVLRTLGAGAIGVQIFFGVSGFILALPFARRILSGQASIPIRPYLIRRVTRLEPPYVIHLLLITALFALAAGSGLIWDERLIGHATPLEFAVRHQPASLVYLHGPATGYANPINCVLWSLEVEVQFYLLMPLLARVFAIRSRAARRTTLLGCMAAASTLANADLGATWLGPTVLGQLHWFLVGFLTADFYLSWNESPSPDRRWDLPAALAWGGFIVLAPIEGARVLLPFVLLACFLSVFRSKVIRSAFTNPWATTIGGMCYTIYLYHYLIILAAGRPLHRWLGGGNGMLSLLALCFILPAIILVFSCGAFLLFERPFMRRDWHLRVWARLNPRSRSHAGEIAPANQ